jgi:PAS domain S-box-containing protein
MHDLPSLAARGRRDATLIGTVYAVAGALWILLSDELVAALSSDPAWLSLAQHYKGLFFIALTTLALVLLIRTGNRRLLAAARELASRELQVDDLFWRHPKPMWVYDEDSLRFLRVNDAAVAEYGYSRDEFLAMTIRDIRPPEAMAQLDQALARARTEDRIQQVYRHRRRSGQQIAARVTSHRVELHGVHARMVMAENITDELAAREIGRAHV